jgi:phosphotriesterase-related protein
MVEAGYRDHIVVSHDHAMCVLGRLGPQTELKYPNWRLTRFFDYVLPQLRKMGLAEADIERILIHNPRRLFENAAGQTAAAGQGVEAAAANAG